MQSRARCLPFCGTKFIAGTLWGCYMLLGFTCHAFQDTAGAALQQAIAPSLFIEVIPDRRTAYEGEPFTAAYYLYVGLDLEGKVTRVPTYRGFASYDLQQGNPAVYEVVTRGRMRLKKYLIKKVMLIGLLTGPQTLEPIEMDATIKWNPEDNAGNEPKVFFTTIRSQPVTIQVQPLPSGADSSFSGAVGSFTLHAAFKKSILPANEADTLMITLKGKGNWPRVQAPAPAWPQDFEVYQAYSVTEQEKTSENFENAISWYFPFTISTPGSYTLPAIRFSWFNPEKKQYQSAMVQPGQLDIIPAIQKPVTTVSNPTTDFTRLFTRIALWVFPLTAVLLVTILLVRHFRNRAKD